MKSTVKAYAKVNLFLDITGRLENGYHTLNTVMQQVDLHDIVTVETTDNENIEIICDNPSIPCDERNIAYKACELFRVISGKRFGARITIEKHIPTEAGMGGSSTDGAAVLCALNEIYSLFSIPQLAEMGAKLGADVPFCIYGGTAVCKGIGDIITPTRCRKDYVLAIAKPAFSCSTPVAYKAYDNAPLPVKTEFDGFVTDLPISCEKWSGKMYNVFEKLYNNPEITDITDSLKKNGALGAILTGSGSAVFGIFKDTVTAENALKNINTPFKFTVNPI